MKVEVVESMVVAPSEETPRQGLWLSNLDLIVPKTHTPLVYYYPAPAPAAATPGEDQDFFSLDRLRSALARALVLFYPLAGRLGVDASGRLQIDCNGQGVLFLVARADCTGEELFADYKPSPEIRRLFVPSGDNPCLAMFQVTFLKCGGVVLGTALHHVPMDGVGAFHFIQTWTGLARGLSVSEACPSPPSHDRTPLRARSPPRADLDLDVYLPGGNPNRGPFATRIYPISSKLLADLKSRCAPGVSTYGAVAAHLWRSICVARGLSPGYDTHLIGPANVRHRLNPPLPRHFCGNAIVRDMVVMKVGDVLAGPPGNVADAIRKEVEQVDDAYARSVIDYLEMEYDKDSNKGPRGLRFSEADLWVVSWLGMPMYDADFGWGLPRFVFPAELHFSGMVFVTQRSVDRQDGISVLLALEPHYLKCFEQAFYAEQ